MKKLIVALVFVLGCYPRQDNSKVVKSQDTIEQAQRLRDDTVCYKIARNRCHCCNGSSYTGRCEYGNHAREFTEYCNALKEGGYTVYE